MITIEQINEVAKQISNIEPYVTGVAVPTAIYEVFAKSDNLKFNYINDIAYIEFNNGNKLSVIHNPLLDSDYILLQYSNGKIKYKKLQIN